MGAKLSSVLAVSNIQLEPTRTQTTQHSPLSPPTSHTSHLGLDQTVKF